MKALDNIVNGFEAQKDNLTIEDCIRDFKRSRIA